MAQGDVVCFDQFLVDRDKKVHNLDSDTIKVGFITNAVTPLATTADPRWGAGGSTNFSTNEVTPGGNYSAGGPSITAGASIALSGGKSVFDSSTDISILQNGSNPTDARWGIMYNDTSTGKECICFIDFGGVTDLTAGNFTLNWNASGIFDTDQA